MNKRELFLSHYLVILLGIVTASSSFALPPIDIISVPTAPDYKQEEAWLAKPDVPTAAVDVFFVYPTVLSNDTDWVMDTKDPNMRTAAQRTINDQASVFNQKANIYAPMYRQMNIASLGLSDADEAPLKKISYNDVWRALNYYLEHENHGRPFFLAGHSQGSMLLTNIMVQHWGSTGAENRLVAAYLIGWSLTPSDLRENPAIKMCEHSTQTGCVISYNTMAKGKQSLAPTLKAGALTVNPLSWTMDDVLVGAEKNIGSVFFNENDEPTTYLHFTSAQIVNSGLIVQPEDINLVTVKGAHFPEGVYHAFDYSLFFENLKVNISDRIAAFIH